jgi:alpha/beta superfamily hydrolase
VHDDGRGEVEDLAAALAWARSEFPVERVVLAGFSFGAAMQVRLAARVPAERMALVGLAVRRIDIGPLPAGTLVIHGERDATVSLQHVLDWARPFDQPVIVVPGADHYFHGKLAVLRTIVQSNWRMP